MSLHLSLKQTIDFKHIAVILSSCILCSCAITQKQLEQKKDVTRISTLSINCKNPYHFTQDCSEWMGAKRTIEINGHKAKIAGTEDSKAILVMDNSPIWNSFKDGLSFGLTDAHGETSNTAYWNIRKKFEENGIHVKRIITFGTMFSKIDGYVLITEEPAYDLLKEYSVR